MSSELPPPTQPLASRPPPPPGAAPPSPGSRAGAPTGAPTGSPAGPPPVPPTASGGYLRSDPVDLALIATGVALLAAAVTLSAAYSRRGGDLDASNFVMGLAATLGLLGVAGAAALAVRDPARRSDLVAWPGAFGALAAGLMVAVLMDEGDATAYVASLVVLALSAAGYVLSRRGTFVVSAIAGLLVLYLQLCDDVLGLGDLEGDNPGVTVGAVVLVFALLVTAGGWLLPGTRVLSAVVAGVIAVVSNVGTLVGLSFAAALTFAFDEPGGRATNELEDDGWWLLVFSLLLVALWAVLTYATRHVAFPVLMAAMAATVVPLVTAVLRAEHPTWWAVAVGVPGGAVLVLAALRALGGPSALRSGGRTSATGGSTGAPPA